MTSCDCLPAAVTPASPAARPDPTGFGPAERFVLGCLARDTQTAEHLLCGGLDMEAMARFAIQHEVVGEVAAHCCEAGLPLPEPVSDALADFAGRIGARCRAVRAETARLAAALSAAGIACAFTKGAVSDQLYRGGACVRTAKDLDLYIHASDLPAVLAALPPDYVVPAKRIDRGTTRRLHHLSVWAPRHEIAVEIHWDVAAPWHAIGFDLAAALGDAEPLRLDGSVVPVFRPSRAIVFWSAELSKDSWVSLKKILDFAASVDAAGDAALQDAAAIAADRGGLRALRVALLIAEALSLVRLTPAARAILGDDPCAHRIAHIALRRLARGRPARWTTRIADGLTFAQKHDRPFARLRHGWNIIVVYRVRGWLGLRAR